MNSKNLFKTYLFVALVAISGAAQAQCKTPDYGADRPTTEKLNALYSDAMKEGKIDVARGPLVWLLNNAPKLTNKIYVDAVDMYDKLATAQTDPAKKQLLVDSLLLVFDARIKNCGEEANVLNRKANASFKFNYKNKEKLPELLALYDKVFELNGNNVSDPSLANYMNTISFNALFVKNAAGEKSLTTEQVIERYDKIMAAADAKIKVAMETNKLDQVEKIKGYKNQVDDIFIKTITGLGGVKCSLVKEKMEPKFRANKELGMAKKMFGFMLADKCTEDPLWLELGDYLIDNGEKDFGLMKNVAIRHIQNGNFERAETLMKEAITLAKEAKDKGEANEILGGLEGKKGNKAGARTYYLAANAADPTNLEALSKIADMYFNSFDDCKQLKSKAEDRLVYLAAYDMYARAKNNGGLAKSKAQFPSKEEIFELSWKAGETKTVSCWIQQNVVLRTRD